MRDLALHDLRTAARGLSKAPGFTAVAVLTLSLGIGASTGMFSILRTALLRPPPFPDADRIVTLVNAESDPNRAARLSRASRREVDFYREHSTSLETVASYINPNLSITGYDQAERVQGELVTPDYFALLRSVPAVGRPFLPLDDAAGARPVTILGHALWMRRFGGDLSILGRQITVNRVPLEVIGIMPPDFAGLSGAADLWIPQAQAGAVVYPGKLETQRAFLAARLVPGASLDQARAELDLLDERMALEVGRPEEAPGRRLETIGRAMADPLNRRAVLVLSGAVGVLLLITCANIGNLLLVRGVAREREMAVRVAVGASRDRLTRWLLTESLLLSMTGGVIGLLLAAGGLRLLGPLLPPRGRVASGTFVSLSDFYAPSLDGTVVLFSLAVSVAVTAIFGILPARRAGRVDPAEALKAGQGPRPRRRMPAAFGGFTSLQVALAVVLVTGAGLLLRSLSRLSSLPRGFDRSQVTSFYVQAPTTVYPAAQAPSLVARVVNRVATAPGVELAAASYYPPFGGHARHQVRREGEVVAEGAERMLGHHYVSPDYFALLRIPFLRGRPFADSDSLGRPPVGIVNRAAAAALWPGEDPIGQRVLFWNRPDTPADSGVEIVGVVEDVRYAAAGEPAGPEIYTPYYQFASIVYALVMARSSGDPSLLAPVLREAVAEVDRGLPASDMQTLDERNENELARRRLSAILLSVFAVIALGVAAVGVYGVVAHLAVMRVREFGVRMALGAGAADIHRLVLRDAVAMIGGGLIVGLLAAWALTRLLTSQLFELSPLDPPTYIVTACLLGMAALLATWIPARRATRIEPLAVLRSE